MNQIRMFKLWVPVVLWAALIFFLSGISDLKTDLEQDFLLRKAAHITEYLILTFFLYRAFRGTWGTGIRVRFLYPALAAFLYAASDESHQAFVPGRTGAVGDVLIDTLGIVLFYVFLFVWMSRTGWRESSR